MKKIKVFIADDHLIMREGLKLILLDDSRIEVVGESGDGKETVDKINKIKPDLAIIDISMPVIGGLDAVRMIRRNNKYVKLIILSRHDNDGYILKAIENGANGYILKESGSEDLLKAVNDIMNGNIFLSPRLVTDFVKSHLGRSSHRIGIPGSSSPVLLTNREKEVAVMLSEGKSNREIASILDISDKTVKIHRFNLMKKLNVRNITELVKFTIKEGMIDL